MVEALGRAGPRWSRTAARPRRRGGATAEVPDERKLLSGPTSGSGAAASVWAEAVAWRGGVDLLVNDAAVMSRRSVRWPTLEWDDPLERAP